MKAYHITQSGNEVILHNDDDNPVIKSFTFKFEGSNVRTLRLEIPNETTEMRRQFILISKKMRQAMGWESLTLVGNDTATLFAFLTVVDQYESVPDKAFNEIEQLIDFNFAAWTVPALASANEDEPALIKAINAFYATQNEQTIIDLANYYEEQQDMNNCLNVLAHIPSSHSHFVEANRKAYRLLTALLNDKVLRVEDERDVNHLEKLLRFALNSQQLDAAKEYFSVLCGYSDPTNISFVVTGNSETLIGVARMHRELNQELQKLKTPLVQGQGGSPKENTSENIYSWYAGNQRAGRVSPQPALTTEHEAGTSNGAFLG